MRVGVPAVTVGINAPQAAAATSASDVMVYVGQQGTSTYEQSLNGVLYTEDSIGFMADRILWTESEIGTMADRIVYVTETSQYNSVEIIYYAYNITLTGMQDGGYLYDVTVQQVWAMPIGW
jgi:hypothetical protein